MKIYKYIFSVFLLFILSLNLHASYSVSEEWSTYVGGQFGNDSVKASVIDANGTLYLGGAVNGFIANDNGVEATTPPYSGGGKDGCVAAVNSDGILQWYVMLISDDGDNGEDDEVRDVAVYGHSVYVGACMQRSAANDDGTDAYLFSLTNTSGSVNWSYDIGEANATNAFNAVTVDTNGNIYAVGYTSITQIDSTPNVPGYQITPGGTTFGQSLQGGLDAFVAKVSPSGSLIWIHYLGGANYDSALTCTIGTNGYLYVGGETCSPGWVSNTSSVFPSPSNKSGFVVKLSVDGDHIWSTYLGGSYNDSVTSLAFENKSGKLFAAGTTASGDYMTLRPRLNSHAGGSDGFVTSITDNGSTRTVNWSKFYGSGVNETISSIRQLNASEMVIGGTTPNGTWLPDADNAYSGGVDGFAVVMQEDNGTNVWSTYVGGSGTESLNTVAARNGIFYAGGMTRSEGWVSNGFHTVWDKLDWFGSADEFGFVAKYQSSGYVPDLPEITSQPQPVTLEEQQDAQFSVASVGTQPIYYQWKVNGAPVADATNTAFTLSGVQLSQDGDLISCTLSNIAGTVDSDNALLTVTAIPNGWVTVDISPADAVNAGAAWSIDSGSTWHADGEFVNAITGDYTVVYADDLYGWAAPTGTVTTTVLNGQTNTLSAIYTELSYSNYREISGTNVTVYIDPPEGNEFFFFSEILPEGLTPYDYAPMTWNPSTRKLTYNMYPSTYIELSYSVTGVEGSYQVSGTVTFGEGYITTAGPDEIVIAGEPVVVPDPDIIAFAPDSGTPGNYLLTFISISGQEYLIETNALPTAAGWAGQGQVSGQADQTTASVPAPHSTLFYRVRTP